MNEKKQKTNLLAKPYMLAVIFLGLVALIGILGVIFRPSDALTALSSAAIAGLAALLTLKVE